MIDIPMIAVVLAGVALIPACLWSATCARCKGSGYIETKHGTVRCPFCNKGTGVQ